MPTLALIVRALLSAVLPLVLASAPKCYWNSHPWCGPYCDNCGPGHESCGPEFGTRGPQFHVMDASCGTQDPNAPIYDPLHGVYHLFWQAHTARPCTGDFRAAPSIGHAVSRDLAHWAHMPVAIWNGGSRAYDGDAIYSCSATLVEGVPTIVYPGLCESSDWANGICKTWPGKGTTLNIATPTNRSDPLSTEWSKSPGNPIANATTDAPSTAWRTATGEWRFMTSGDDANWIFSSADFKTWRYVGNLTGAASGACPSLFPFPPVTAGVGGKRPPNATHVAKTSLSTPEFHDILTVGSYASGAPNSTGTWTTLLNPATVDGGQVFAGKDMWDPVKKRRLYWAWAHDVAPASALTLAREITWHGVLQQLIYTPIEEQALLRRQKLTKLGRTPLIRASAGRYENVLWLSKEWEPGEGNSTEIHVTFTLPNHSARVGVVVMTSSTIDGGTAAPADGTLFYVDYVPQPSNASSSSWTVRAGAVDVSHDDLKDGGNYSVASRSRSSGPPSFWPPFSQDLRMLKTDHNLTLTIFVDNTFAECFFAGGRTVLTRSVAASPNGPPLAAGVAVVGNVTKSLLPPTNEMSVDDDNPPSLTIEAATAWHVGSLWVTPAEVIATPRLFAS